MYLRRLLAIGLCAMLVTACTPGKPAFRGNDLSGVTWGGDHQLLAHTGAPMRLSDARGKVAVLFFGYTHCPDICAPTLAKLTQVRAQLGTDAAKVQVFFISVDPVHDTPAQMREFLKAFDPSFIGLTGTPAEVEVISRDYKITATPEPGQRITHSGGVFVRDQQGRLRLFLNESASVDDIAHDLKILLSERH
jgi:protein SCO1/2